ncbi:uncharacterized protein LOC114229545 isoform X2 [Eptesicus fuscus]|uniref:uncharacterized protein LOC114229545 isoform X2 n=1 Tax=Eptesicus fuscus TaxID=29078 RepID=UPI00240432D0|nr:uncharacterized protein LOC114229545 isoform X2 [Eptesicus fuscus]
MWPLLVLLLLGLASCGSAQLLFNTTESVEYTKDNKTVVIPCLVNNLGAQSFREMFVKWKFKNKHIFYYDGDKNESKPISEFSSAHIVIDTLLSGDASLVMDKSQAVPGKYTCEVTELTREGETSVELKFVKTPLLFTTIKSVEYTNNNKTVLIPCLFTNSEAKSLKEMFVKWKFRDKYIFNYDGEKNESKPTSEFSSAHIVPDALLTGIASLVMGKTQAVLGIYTCEVSELSKEGKTTIELKYRVVKTQLIFTTIKSVEYTNDNKTVLIPCLVTNSAAKSLKEMFVNWKFRDKYIFNYDGNKNKFKPTSEFSSAYIVPGALLRGNASLMMGKSQAVPGNYTCEVSELTKEGKTTIELKYNVVKTQLLFTTIESVEYTICNDTLIIPCLVTNVEAKSLREMFVKWKFGDKHIFFYDGDKNKSKPISEFSSAHIMPDALLKGNASLMMNKNQAVPGNYNCEVTELTREGETTVELKYRVGLWFSSNDHMLIILFPMLAVLLFWGSDIVILKYNSNITKKKIIILSVAGLILSILVIVGIIFFIPGDYSTTRASGLGLIVIPTVILILLQISMFIIAPANGMSPISHILLTTQVLGLLTSVAGLSLCVSECIPVHGSLLISGLGITALVAFLGLVYMISVALVHSALPLLDPKVLSRRLYSLLGLTELKRWTLTCRVVRCERNALTFKDLGLDSLTVQEKKTRKVTLIYKRK